MSSVYVPAGKYVLSDPCYVVPQDMWIHLLESCDYFNEPEGRVEKYGTEYKVYAFATAYGDGSYTSSEGHDLGVDSGLIGLTPVELIDTSDHEYNAKNHIVEFTHTTQCYSNEGVLHFGNITVNTEYDESVDYSEDEEY